MSCSETSSQRAVSEATQPLILSIANAVPSSPHKAKRCEPEAEAEPSPYGFSVTSNQARTADHARSTKGCSSEANSNAKSANDSLMLNWRGQAQELSDRMRTYTERSTATELFELADQSSLRSSMRSGYVECAKCKRSLLDTAHLDGRCEVKVLPCFHCICAPCLQTALSASSDSEMSISCPTCSTSCKRMPLHNFLPHFEVHSMRDSDQIASRDFMCEECISANRAEYYCGTCVMNLCNDCSTQHKRSKSTARHMLSSLTERKEKGEIVQRHRALYCATHRNNCYKLYCEDCDMIICYQCATESHQTHSYKLPTESMVERHRRQIHDVLDRLGNKLSEAQELQRCIHRGLVDLEAAASKGHDEVNAAFDELLAATEARCDFLLNPLQESCREWREQLLSERSECSKALVDIWRTIDFLEKVITRGTDIEVLKVRGQLFKEWHQVKQLQDWQDLSHRPHRCFWNEGDIRAGWRSQLEADAVVRLLWATGKIEARPLHESTDSPQKLGDKSASPDGSDKTPSIAKQPYVQVVSIDDDEDNQDGDDSESGGRRRSTVKRTNSESSLFDWYEGSAAGH